MKNNNSVVVVLVANGTQLLGESLEISEVGAALENALSGNNMVLTRIAFGMEGTIVRRDKILKTIIQEKINVSYEVMLKETCQTDVIAKYLIQKYNL